MVRQNLMKKRPWRRRSAKWVVVAGAVVKTGNGSLGISSVIRQAIKSLLASKQASYPNQSVRALLKGNVGKVIASLIDFR